MEQEAKSDSEYSDVSSDDSVCMGPYTVKEAKKDARKCRARKIDRRHSSIYRHFDLSKEIQTLTARLAETVDLSANPSEYLTPNETMPSEEESQNSEFLDKLSKVINEPVSGSTSYNTAFDHTNIQENGSNQQLQQEVLDQSIITVSDESSLQLHTSAYEFVSNEDLNESKSPVMTHMEDRCQELIIEAINDEFGADRISVKREVVDISDSSIVIDNEDQYSGSLDSDINNKYFQEKIDASEEFSSKKLTANLEEDGADKISVKREVVDISDSSIDNEDQYFGTLDSDISNDNLQKISASEEFQSKKLTANSEGDVTTESSVFVDYDNLYADSLELNQAEKRKSGTIQSEAQLDQSIDGTQSVSPVSSSFVDVKNELENLLDSSEDDEDIIPSTPATHEPHQRIMFNYNQLSKISEKSGEYVTCADSFQSSDSGRASIIIPEIKVTEAVTSPVHIPMINLNQFDNSCDFDDTLEEMNRFLAEGTDYEMPERTTPVKPRVTPQKQPLDSEDVGHLRSESIPRNLFSPISGSFMNRSSQDNPGLKNRTPTPNKLFYSDNKAKKFYSAEKITKPSVEVGGPKTTGKSKFHHMESKIKPPSVSAKTLFSKIPQQKPKTESAFKLPNKPVKKLVTPGKNFALKNVVSPIGVYINHSPKYCPMIKVPQNKPQSLRGAKLYQPGPSAKENVPETLDLEIPAVIYKPAKTKYESEVREVNLPKNIRKLISPQVVTKHERRIIESDVTNQSLERRLIESDLSIDVSRLSEDGCPDISILTHKQPFNLRKY